MISYTLLLFCCLSSSYFGEGFILQPDHDPDRLSVATYNIWNIMFNWDIRKLRIAQLIRETDPDIIGFQEVRADKDGGRNQVAELSRLLPEYQWHAHIPASQVLPLKHAYKEGWEMEGVGILSRLPIVNHTSHILKYRYGPDTNHRMLLHARIDGGERGTIDVLVVHFSYDRHQQCSNAVDIVDYIKAHSLQNVILLGDFNVYNDFPWPLGLLTASSPQTKEENLCISASRQFLVDSTGMSLRDCWQTVHSGEHGYTFSNMPTPGLESRPDRILMSPSFQVMTALLYGADSSYEENFYAHLLWNRLESVISALWDAFRSRQGRSCYHDCGPHASCRCGVCVSGGDTRACLLPDCEECMPYHFVLLLSTISIFTVLTIQLIYALLRVFHTMNRDTRQPLVGIFGWTSCCLCNPDLYKPPSGSWRTRSSSRWFICRRIPPMILLAITVSFLYVFCQFVMFLFYDTLADVYAVIPEELFPSDHLYFIVQLTWTKSLK